MLMSPPLDLSVECVGQKWLLVLCGMMLLLSVFLTKKKNLEQQEEDRDGSVPGETWDKASAYFKFDQRMFLEMFSFAMSGILSLNSRLFELASVLPWQVPSDEIPK